MATEDDLYDVVVIGSGLTGSLLGCILARVGVRVAIVDGGTHPKCSPGELVPPDVITALRALDRAYDVPEIRALTRYENCSKFIGRLFGEHRELDVVADRPSAPRADALRVQHGSASTASAHLYRPAADSYLFYAAVAYGCTPHQGWPIAEITWADDGVTLTNPQGGRVRGRYLLETTPAPSSALVREQGVLGTLPDEEHRDPATMWWAHFVQPRSTGGSNGAPPSNRALCAVFDGGWARLVPLNTDRQSAPMYAVTFVTDAIDPGTPADPRAVLAELTSRAPTVGRHLASARLVREWEPAPLGYAGAALSGRRWCLVGPAAAGLDPLLGGDFRLVAASVQAVVPALREALAAKEAPAAPFAAVERQLREQIEVDHTLVQLARDTFEDRTRWQLVLRSWLARTSAAARSTTGIGDDRVEGLLAKARTADTEELRTMLAGAWPDGREGQFADLNRHGFSISHA